MRSMTSRCTHSKEVRRRRSSPNQLPLRPIKSCPARSSFHQPTPLTLPVLSTLTSLATMAHNARPGPLPPHDAVSAGQSSYQRTPLTTPRKAASIPKMYNRFAKRDPQLYPVSFSRLTGRAPTPTRLCSLQESWPSPSVSQGTS